MDTFGFIHKNCFSRRELPIKQLCVEFETFVLPSTLIPLTSVADSSDGIPLNNDDLLSDTSPSSSSSELSLKWPFFTDKVGAVTVDIRVSRFRITAGRTGDETDRFRFDFFGIGRPQEWGGLSESREFKENHFPI